VSVALPAGQRNRLDTIENSLRASDPQLAALFTIFSRLGQDEQMPRTEELDTGLARVVLAWLRQLVRPGAPTGRRSGRPRARIRGVLFFPAALAVMACGVWLGNSLSGPPRCAVLPRTIGIPQLIASGKARTRTPSGPPGTKTRVGSLAGAAGTGRAKASAACSAIRWPITR
jgi:hypothetical protein